MHKNSRILKKRKLWRSMTSCVMKRRDIGKGETLTLSTVRINEAITWCLTPDTIELVYEIAEHYAIPFLHVSSCLFLSVDFPFLFHPPSGLVLDQTQSLIFFYDCLYSRITCSSIPAASFRHHDVFVFQLKSVPPVNRKNSDGNDTQRLSVSGCR